MDVPDSLHNTKLAGEHLQPKHAVNIVQAGEVTPTTIGSQLQLSEPCGAREGYLVA